MITPLILSIPHALSCIALALASFYWKYKRDEEHEAYRFLFPYLIAVGILGMARITGPVMGITMAGMEHGFKDVYTYYLSGENTWIFGLTILLPLLPAFGIIPAIGRKSLVVGCLALLAMLPTAFAIYSDLI